MTRFVKNDETDKLSIFYNKAYGQNHILDDPLHHNWQFKINPFNKLSSKSILINEYTEISSHLGLIPTELKIYDEIKTACWHVSFFTLEEYRGRSLGSKLLEYSNNFFDFTMVLSGSEGTKKIYLNTKGKYLGNLNRYIGILDKTRIESFSKTPIDKNSLKKEITDNYEFTKISELEESYTLFWDKVKHQYPITINRTRSYLDWRYISHPLIDYHFLLLKNGEEILGYVVLRFENNNDELKSIRIIDLIVFEEFELNLLQHTINYCLDKADFLDFFCTGSIYSKSFF